LQQQTARRQRVSLPPALDKMRFVDDAVVAVSIVGKCGADECTRTGERAELVALFTLVAWRRPGQSTA
jgi:hypothetical protein